MKTPLRILVAVLCAALIVCMPFILSSPSLLNDAQEAYLEDREDEEEGEELDFGRLFFSGAIAEEEFSMEDEDVEDLFSNPGKKVIPEEWALGWDFSIPPAPDPDKFTENGYEDRSISVRIEERKMKDSIIHVAFVDIASPTQLRTATVAGVGSQRTNYMKAISDVNNAVIAMNGDLFVEVPDKKTFEFRMTEVVTYKKKRNRTNKLRDALVIDKNGDFHLFVKSQGLSDYTKAHGNEIVNAFMFGPALVQDGEIVKTDTEYAYAPNSQDARSAIGQTGALSYAMVIVEGRGDRTKSKGVTHEELAEIMYELGCIQAYNLDGGNTAEMLMTGSDSANPMIHLKGDQESSKYRTHSDIIYFATAVPEGERE